MVEYRAAGIVGNAAALAAAIQVTRRHMVQLVAHLRAHAALTRCTWCVGVSSMHVTMSARNAFPPALCPED